MKIGIDARLIEETGVGRYTRNLISQLALIDKTNRYVVFLRRKSYAAFVAPNKRWEKRLADVPWHSLREQLIMPLVLWRAHLDLVHVPYHNPLILYPGKFIVTIHDLTILHFATGKATTLPLPLYWLRRWGYHLVLTVGLARARQILAVSQTTKQEIVNHFHISPHKITVTHEGVDKQLLTTNPAGRDLASPDNLQLTTKKPLIMGKYFLYIGNAYPHKNLETFLRAFQRLSLSPQKVKPFAAKLVLVGTEDYFYKQLKKEVARLSLLSRVMFYGRANDEQLKNLYRHAAALVFPSLMEGFGLPGLEAMAAGTPVVCSDIGVFREIYRDAALFFDPVNEEDIRLKLQMIVEDTKLREKLSRKGREHIKRFSWGEMAKETLSVYNQVCESGFGIR